MSDLPRPGSEPGLAGNSLSTGPPGSICALLLLIANLFSLDFKICFIIFMDISVSGYFQCSQADGLHDTLTGLVVCIGVKFSYCSMAMFWFDGSICLLDLK